MSMKQTLSMARQSWQMRRLWVQIVILFTILKTGDVNGVTFKLENSCPYSVWPGMLANAGSLQLEGGGLKLEPGESISLDAGEGGWSGRIWGRTSCHFSPNGTQGCASGDCGGRLQCGGMGATPPATLAEFTLSPRSIVTSGQDFYDISLVDGFNLRMAIIPVGGSGTCQASTCMSDINQLCPVSLQILSNHKEEENQGVIACQSACGAFGSPEFCCQGPFASPSTCAPSSYSRLFKGACPRAYSYAFDDATSTFTCSSPNSYNIIFCPSTTPSQKTLTGLQQPSNDIMGSELTYATSNGHEISGFRNILMTIFICLLAIMFYI